MTKLKQLIRDTRGDAVVEATILFPIMIMIFAALVLLSMYLPVRSTLQHATQYAATAIATERSDSWLYYNQDTMKYEWKTGKDELNNVYYDLIKSVTADNDSSKAEAIVRNIEKNSISITTGALTVDYGVVNYVVYKEIVVTATRTIPAAVDLSFIGFPKEIPIVVTSTAVVQNGDEFIRNIDIAVDFVEYLDEKYAVSDTINKNQVFQKVKELVNNSATFLGWK